MEQRRIYFKDVIHVGNLYLEKILFEFDKLPIVFSCMDSMNKRYLCLCIDSIDMMCWMIVPIDLDVLLQILKDEKPVLYAFAIERYDVIIAEQHNSNDIYFKKMEYNQIPKEDLPDANELLECDDAGQYIQELEWSMAEEILLQTIRDQIRKEGIPTLNRFRFDAYAEQEVQWKLKQGTVNEVFVGSNMRYVGCERKKCKLLA